MKKFTAGAFALLMLFYGCAEEDEKATLAEVNKDALKFIEKNGIELPLSVSLEEIDDLKSDEFSSFSLSSASGSTLAEAEDYKASGSSSSATVNVGISLSSSLASSRAEIPGLDPKALVVDEKAARLVSLLYDSNTGLYAASVNLGNGTNYICVIVFKDGVEWRKSPFLRLIVSVDYTDEVWEVYKSTWKCDEEYPPEFCPDGYVTEYLPYVELNEDIDEDGEIEYMSYGFFLSLIKGTARFYSNLVLNDPGSVQTLAQELISLGEQPGLSYCPDWDTAYTKDGNIFTISNEYGTSVYTSDGDYMTGVNADDPKEKTYLRRAVLPAGEINEFCYEY